MQAGTNKPLARHGPRARLKRRFPNDPGATRFTSSTVFEHGLQTTLLGQRGLCTKSILDTGVDNQKRTLPINKMITIERRLLNSIKKKQKETHRTKC